MFDFQVVLTWISTAGIVTIGYIAAIQWLLNRPNRSRGYLAAALCLLASVSLLSQINTFLGIPLHLYTVIASGLFLVCGYAFFLFRGTLVPLPPFLKNTSLALVVGLTVASATPINQEYLGLAIVIVWIAFILESIVRLYGLSRRLGGTQQGRVRALAAGYTSIVLLLIILILVGPINGTGSQVTTFTNIFAIVILLPILYCAFLPPKPLRQYWRVQEQENFAASLRDLISFSPNREVLAERALAWVLRIVGSSAGAILDAKGSILASNNYDATLFAKKREILNSTQMEIHPELGIVYPVHISEGIGYLVIKPPPLTPLFGLEDMDYLDQYVVALSLALDRVDLFAISNKLEHEARNANQTKSAFLASISHELRTPLSAILGFADVLASGVDGELNPAQSEDVKFIHTSGTSLLHLLDELLDLSKIEAGHMQANPEIFNLKEVIQQTIATLKPLAERKSLPFIVTLAPNPIVYADPLRVSQVLINLIGNAIKYTETGSIEVKVLPPKNDFVRIEITDTGMGIAPADRHLLFSEFTQVGDLASRKVSGAGLGLAISRHLVELQNGKIGVTSLLGSGSTFWFTLPALPPLEPKS